MDVSGPDAREDAMPAQFQHCLVATFIATALAFATPWAEAGDINLDKLFGCHGQSMQCAECGEVATTCGELYQSNPGCPVAFDGSFVQIFQSVVNGGNRQRSSLGGSGRYGLTFDLGAMGVHDGMSLRMVTDHQMGDFVSTDAGVILPPGLAALTPLPSTHDPIVTNLILTQVIDENWTVFAGKMDTLDGDRNPFASGRGRTGFMNTSLLLPVNGVPIVPFATLGAGAIYSVDGNPAASLLVLNATDTTAEVGLSDLFRDGAIILGTLNLPFSCNDQLGFQTLNYAYSTKTFTSLSQDPRVILPNVPLAPTEGGWVAWWSGTQFIQQFDPKNNPMLGWGLFGRFGVSDDLVAPITYWANFGLGGNSCINGRQNDRWGVGWFYSSFSDNLGPIVTAALNVGAQTTGVELFYNFAVTENFFVTPDIQVIKPGQNNTDTAVVAGIRGEIRI